MAQAPEGLLGARQDYEAGSFHQAVRIYREDLQADPDKAEGPFSLGNALMVHGLFAEAATSYDEAIRLRPDFAEAHNNLGVALAEQGQLAAAVAKYEQALQLQPDLAEAHYDLGNALLELDQLDAALKSFQEALRLKPDWAEAHANLGLALQRQGNVQEALAHYDQAIQLHSDFAAAHLSRAQALLLLGDFAKGWPEYEWRWQIPGVSSHPVRGSLWDGSPLAGRTILVWTEQGMGDTFQFIRYAPLVQAMGGRVLVECPESLVPLLVGCRGIDQLIARGSSLPIFDVQAPLLSLPGIVDTTLSTIPADIPYLFAPPKRVEHWRRELSSLRAIKIGIAWQGDPSYSGDRQRSIPLAHFAPLARLDGVLLISLQKGPGTEQLTRAAEDFRIMDLGSQLDETSSAFIDTAAVMKNLDLVITSDTALAHLAGGLGIPVWLALAWVPEWRFLLDRDDSPWYPTMRLFRQTQSGDWANVVRRMTVELKKVLESTLQVGSITTEIGPGELIDRIAILEIENDRLAHPNQLNVVCEELAHLRTKRDRAMEQSDEVAGLALELKAVDETLWQTEDDIRLCEAAKNFGPRFMESARSIYRLNDRRAAVKRRIDEICGAAFLEKESCPAFK